MEIRIALRLGGELLVSQVERLIGSRHSRDRPSLLLVKVEVTVEQSVGASAQRELYY